MANLDQIMEHIADEMTVEDVAVTYTTSTGTITSVECKKYGKVVQLRIVGKNTATTAVGGNLFAGTISLDYMPALGVNAASYSSQYAFIGFLNTTGNLTVRSTANVSLSSGVTVGVAFTYITE